MESVFTESPWSSDVAGQIYAMHGRPGHTLVATLTREAPARLLAAAPLLLDALERAMPVLEREMHKLSGDPMVSVFTARNLADAARAHARNGYSASARPTRSWAVNEELPLHELKANEHLLDAAEEMRDALKTVLAAVAGRIDERGLVDQFRSALMAAQSMD